MSMSCPFFKLGIRRLLLLLPGTEGEVTAHAPEVYPRSAPGYFQGTTALGAEILFAQLQREQLTAHDRFREDPHRVSSQARCSSSGTISRSIASFTALLLPGMLNTRRSR